MDAPEIEILFYDAGIPDPMNIIGDYVEKIEEDQKLDVANFSINGFFVEFFIHPLFFHLHFTLNR